MRAKFLGAQGTVQTDRERPAVGNRVPESLDGLTRKCSATGIGNGPRNHHRNPVLALLEALTNALQPSMESPVEGDSASGRADPPPLLALRGDVAGARFARRDVGVGPLHLPLQRRGVPSDPHEHRLTGLLGQLVRMQHCVIGLLGRPWLQQRQLCQLGNDCRIEEIL